MLKSLFQPRVVECGCVSILPNGSAELEEEYVGEAIGWEIRLRLQWPLWSVLFGRKLSFRLLDREGGDLVPPGAIAASQRWHWLTSAVTVGLPPALAAREPATRLQVYWRERPVFERELVPLNRDELLDELTVEEVRVFVANGGRQVACDRLHTGAGELGFELWFELADVRHRHLFSGLGIEAEVILQRQAETAPPVGSWRCALNFKEDRLFCRQSLGSVQRSLDGRAGDYVFSVDAGERRLARHAFKVVDYQRWQRELYQAIEQQLGGSTVEFHVLDRHGNARPLEEVAEDFRAVGVETRLEVARLDPLQEGCFFDLSSVVQRVEDHLEAGRHSEKVELVPGINRVVGLWPISPDLFRHGPGRYRLSVALGNVALGSREFVHKTRAQLRRERAEAIHATLTLAEPRLIAMRDGARVETETIFETDQFIVPEFTVKGDGFDEDAPALRWRLKMVVRNLESGEEREYLCELIAREGATPIADERLAIGRDGRMLEPGCYRMRFLKRNVEMAQIRFRVHSRQEAVDLTTRQILGSVCAREVHLEVQAGDHAREAARIPETVDLLRPRWQIEAGGFNSVVPAVRATLRLAVRQDGDPPAELVAFPVTLSATPLPVRNLAIRFKGTQLAARRGPVQLLVFLDRNELARLEFDIVAEEEVCRQTTIVHATLSVAKGRQRWQEAGKVIDLAVHDRIMASISLRAGIPAPYLSLEGAIVLLQEHRVLCHAVFRWRPGLQAQAFRIKGVRLDQLGLDESKDRPQLELAIFLGNEKRHSMFVSIRARQTITDAEGQLTMDPERLGSVSDEYAAILEGLDSSTPARR